MRTYKQFHMGLIGCGHMGMAIARGAVRKEYLERYQVCVYDPSEEVRDACIREGFTVLESEKEVAKKAHIVMLAVTPQIIDEVLENLKGETPDCVLSIVTGVSIKYIQDALDNAPVIRAMPNTPLQINEGATALCKSENCKADEYDFVFQLFNSMGVTRTIPEDKMNEVIAVHGSTPAYMYYFVECILKDAVSRGIDEYSARDLLVQTFIGAGKLLAENRNVPISTFIKEVCSKGGTTIEAITELKARNMEEIVHDANEKCIQRAREIGR